MWPERPGRQKAREREAVAELPPSTISHEFIYLFKLLERYLCWLSWFCHHSNRPSGLLPAAARRRWLCVCSCRKLCGMRVCWQRRCSPQTMESRPRRQTSSASARYQQGHSTYCWLRSASAPNRSFSVEYQTVPRTERKAPSRPGASRASRAPIGPSSKSNRVPKQPVEPVSSVQDPESSSPESRVWSDRVRVPAAGGVHKSEVASCSIFFIFSVVVYLVRSSKKPKSKNQKNRRRRRRREGNQFGK